MEYDKVSLVCPLSEKRILTPVRISSNSDLGPFDKTNFLSKLASKYTFHTTIITVFVVDSGDFTNFGIEYELTPNDLQDDEEVVRYLMYYPWESDENIITWRNPPTQNIPM